MTLVNKMLFINCSVFEAASSLAECPIRLSHLISFGRSEKRIGHLASDDLFLCNPTPLCAPSTLIIIYTNLNLQFMRMLSE